MRTTSHATLRSLATSGGCTATLTSGLIFQHEIVTITLQCTVFDLEALDRQTDGRIAASFSAPYRRGFSS